MEEVEARPLLPALGAGRPHVEALLLREDHEVVPHDQGKPVPGLPRPPAHLAGPRVHAGEGGAAAHAVEEAAVVDGDDVGRAQDGSGPEGLDGRAAVGARHEAQHGRAVLAELQEEAAVAGRHGNDALGGDRVHLAAVRVLPEQATGRGVDAEDPGVAHRDHLLPAAHRQQDGRLVRDAVVPETPAPLSGGEVEARDRTAARGPERDHEHAPGHDRGRAETVEGQLRALARHEVHGPQLTAGGRVEAEEVAARPETEDPSAAQGRRRDRAVERAVPARERRRDRVAPELLPGARVEGGGHVLAAVGEEGDGAALGHRDRGVAGAERGTPGHGEAGPFRSVEGRERSAVVPGAPQAGPVRGVGHRHARKGARRRQNGEGFHRESVREATQFTSRERGRGLDDRGSDAGACASRATCRRHDRGSSG